MYTICTEYQMLPSHESQAEVGIYQNAAVCSNRPALEGTPSSACPAAHTQEACPDALILIGPHVVSEDADRFGTLRIRFEQGDNEGEGSVVGAAIT